MLYVFGLDLLRSISIGKISKVERKKIKVLWKCLASPQKKNYGLEGGVLHYIRMLAVIKTGGKQYIVKPGQKIKIEKLDKKEGSEITFSEVLLLEKNKKVEIGTPFLKKVKVSGKVLQQGKDKKKIVFKYKAKKRYKVKKGHRQLFTEVEILKIEALA